MGREGCPRRCPRTGRTPPGLFFRIKKHARHSACIRRPTRMVGPTTHAGSRSKQRPPQCPWATAALCPRGRLRRRPPKGHPGVGGAVRSTGHPHPVPDSVFGLRFGRWFEVRGFVATLSLCFTRSCWQPNERWFTLYLPSFARWVSLHNLRVPFSGQGFRENTQSKSKS